jgi:hypothetical protein
MQPDTVGGMSRQKARERIDTVLASMDTIRLYMTAAALWRTKNDTSLYQPDIRIYAECGHILAEDIHYKAQPATPDRDIQIGVVVEYLSRMEDEELAAVTPQLISESRAARREEAAAAEDPPNILQFPG